MPGTRESSHSLTTVGHQSESAGHQLVIIIPYIESDVERLLLSMQQWSAAGQACSSSLSGRGVISLRLLHSLSYSQWQQRGTKSLQAQMLSIPSIADNVLRCVTSVETLYCGLSEQEEGYPAGPSNMFFRLMLSIAPTHLRAFTHMYWMEWDVKPVRAYWMDALYDATNGEAFWMRGARYLGWAFDALVQRDPTSWSWVGHINGNALYALHNTEFERFLRLTAEMEPPSHFWKPFDVSIWKTLHSFPYSWHLYQLYRDLFATTSIFAHPGFTCNGSDDIQGLIAQGPHVHLIHGDSTSAGSVQFALKFTADGHARTNSSPVLLHDEVPAHLRISIFVRASLLELPLARYALLSAKSCIPNLLEAVVVVQESDEEVARQALPAFVTVQREQRALVMGDDERQRQHTLLGADLYCVGDYILLLDPETLFFRPLLQRDLFIFRRPIVSFYTWRDEAQQQRIASTDEDNQYFLFPRTAYAEARRSLQGDHSSSSLSGFTAAYHIAEYLYKHRPDSLSWSYVGDEEPEPKYSLPYGYATFRPQLLCRGDARLPPELQWEQLQILQSISLGHSQSCDALQDFLQLQQDQLRMPREITDGEQDLYKDVE